MDFLFSKTTPFKHIVHDGNLIRRIIPATKNNRHGHRKYISPMRSNNTPHAKCCVQLRIFRTPSTLFVAGTLRGGADAVPDSNTMITSHGRSLFRIW